MTKRLTSVLAVAALIGCGTLEATAQVFTPTFQSPQRGSDVGVYLSDGPGDFAVEGIWRRTLGDYDLGFRAGLADRRGVVLLLGAEFRTPLDLPDVPVSMAITAGVQGAIGDGGASGFQGGLSIGYPIREPGFTFVPYIHPRIALVNRFGRDDVDLDPLADVGFDVVFAQGISIRTGILLSGPGASWGIGFAWR